VKLFVACHQVVLLLRKKLWLLSKALSVVIAFEEELKVAAIFSAGKHRHTTTKHVVIALTLLSLRIEDFVFADFPESRPKQNESPQLRVKALEGSQFEKHPLEGLDVPV
jgi:hypothetical protein